LTESKRGITFFPTAIAKIRQVNADAKMLQEGDLQLPS
jgi:hypothetical protein